MSENAGRAIAEPPLDAVANACAACLRAETDENRNAADEAQERLMSATTTAMRAGIPLREISAAEQRGRNAVRDELRSGTLKRVERTGRQVREAETTHHAAIARAMHLGLSTREIAQAVGASRTQRFAPSQAARELRSRPRAAPPRRASEMPWRVLHQPSNHGRHGGRARHITTYTADDHYDLRQGIGHA